MKKTYNISSTKELDTSIENRDKRDFEIEIGDFLEYSFTNNDGIISNVKEKVASIDISGIISLLGDTYVANIHQETDGIFDIKLHKGDTKKESIKKKVYITQEQLESLGFKPDEMKDEGEYNFINHYRYYAKNGAALHYRYVYGGKNSTNAMFISSSQSLITEVFPQTIDDVKMLIDIVGEKSGWDVDKSKFLQMKNAEMLNQSASGYIINGDSAISMPAEQCSSIGDLIEYEVCSRDKPEWEKRSELIRIIETPLGISTEGKDFSSFMMLMEGINSKRYRNIKVYKSNQKEEREKIVETPFDIKELEALGFKKSFFRGKQEQMDFGFYHLFTDSGVELEYRSRNPMMFLSSRYGRFIDIDVQSIDIIKKLIAIFTK